MTKYNKKYSPNIVGRYITKAKLNMRVAASKDEKIITIIPKGAEVFCTGYCNDNWYYIRYKDNSGFCDSEWLEK